MQYKNKRNLYKIVFITILLGFIILLVGCDWLSLGLLNIFDPQAQIRIKNFEYVADDDDCKNIVTFDVFTINQVEFIGSGIELEYYRGSTKLDSLKSSVGVNFYVAPSDGPGVEGESTSVELCLYTSAVLDYVKTYSAFNEITCDLYIMGTDGAGHDLKVKVASGISALGADNTSPNADIAIEPPEGGPCPLTVIFDGSGSDDGGDGLGIAKYEWYLPQVSSGIVSTSISFYTTFSCDLVTDSEETITVNLTVTDYYGNMDNKAGSFILTNPESSSDGGCS